MAVLAFADVVDPGRHDGAGYPAFFGQIYLVPRPTDRAVTQETEGEWVPIDPP